MPTLYALLKTHKFNATQLSSTSDILSQCKLRPIVSCCGSPTEKLAWVATTVLSPLLNYVPSHLKNIHSHLEDLSNLSSSELCGLSFFTADVTSLYTNIDIMSCVQSVIDMAEEHWDELDTWGLTLTDLHRILEFVFTNSFFVFNNRLYKQLVGLFMGCKPSPIGAIIRVFMFEKHSIYVDIYFITNPVSKFYKRYVDDAGSLARSKEEAEAMLQLISNQDPSGLLKWELDYPEPGQFTPFLDTEIKIEADGTLQYRYYRKPQKKNITLHVNSHHPLSTKIETVKNFYKTAKICSTPEHTVSSQQKIDNLLQNNGYTNPREFSTQRLPKPRGQLSSSKLVCLKLPYISEQLSHEIRQFVVSHDIPIRLILTPGTKLKDLVCSSRPYDKRRCSITNCIICPLLDSNKYDCTVRGCIYKVTCNLCCMSYVGETYRECHDRFLEHRRAATSPATYPEEALAEHYKNCHPGSGANLRFEILDRANGTVRRKILESYYIFKLKPEINNKDECKLLERFLVK